MTTEPSSPPRAFLSYSWSSENHQAWVMRLAERLQEDGVEMILDKWDLHPGHDAIAFMEQMVTDPRVSKVLLVCDRIYAEKANGRLGGVGKEAQILTPEIYEKADQDKYAALITEKDDDGKAFTPAYYGGRQFIDFTQADREEESYETLLRWIFNRPRHVKPRLGQPPAFITDPQSVATATTSRFKRAAEAVRAASPAAPGLITEFGETLIAEFVERAPDTDAEPYDDEVIRAAEAMRPGLRHLIELIRLVARFPGPGFDQILALFERMGGLMYRPAHVTRWREDHFDPYRMMAYEGFLALTAILIEEQRFDLLGSALDRAYFIEGREPGVGPATTSYRVFAQRIESFEDRKRRLASNRTDLYSDLIHETYKASVPSTEQMIQADILLFLRGLMEASPDYETWWPRMIIYVRRHQPLGLFARSESRAFLNNWAARVLAPFSIGSFKQKVNAVASEYRGSFGFPSPNLPALTNLERLGSRP